MNNSLYFEKKKINHTEYMIIDAPEPMKNQAKSKYRTIQRPDHIGGLIEQKQFTDTRIHRTIPIDNRNNNRNNNQNNNQNNKFQFIPKILSIDQNKSLIKIPSFYPVTHRENIQDKSRLSSNLIYESNINILNNPIKPMIKPKDQGAYFKSYVSLTSVPTRLLSDHLFDVLDSLTTQSVPASKIFLSVCTSYKRKFNKQYDAVTINQRIVKITESYPSVQVIRTKDYGPATKILGLLEYNAQNKFLNPWDQIIVVDDDTIYSKNMILSHSLCHQLYGSDVTAINEDTLINNWSPYSFNINQDNVFFQNNYNGFLYGWLSFGIMYRVTHDLTNFFIHQLKIFPGIFFHDDLLFSLFTYKKKLHVVENKFIPILGSSRTSGDSIEPLRDIQIDGGTKYNLEEKVYSHHGIKIHGKSFLHKKTNYVICTQIPRRDIYLVNHLDVKYLHDDIHVLFTFLDAQHMLMTISVFDMALIGTNQVISFTLMNKNYTIPVVLKNSSKISYLVSMDQKIEIRQHENQINYSIIQTYSSNEISENRLNSIHTILNLSPEYSYKFFDDKLVFAFLRNFYSDTIYNAINNLVPGAYISDMFRYCYLYLNGGIYMDCKKIMYIPMSDYIRDGSVSETGEIYIKDCLHNYAYNAIMVTHPFTEVMKRSILYSVFKIIKNKYDKDPLSLTGPGCLGDCVDEVYGKNYSYHYFNLIPKKDHDWLSYNVDTNNKRVIKNTYHGYYDENNYRSTGHYHVLWHNSKIYKKDLSNEYKHIQNITDIKLLK